MPVITTSSRFGEYSTRICSSAKLTAKTIKAYPITSALFTTALVSSIAATAVLFALGFGSIGAISIGFGASVLIGGGFYFDLKKHKIQHKAFNKNHSLELKKDEIRGKEVCLVLTSTNDHNGSLNYGGRPTKWEKKYPIVSFNVSSLKEMEEAIDQVSKIAKIQVLWINAHGSQLMLSIGKGKEHLNVFNAADFQSSFNKIQQNGTVVLAACSTAATDKKLFSNENVASEISKFAPGRKVIGSSALIRMDSIKVRNGSKARLSILGPRWGSREKTCAEKLKSTSAFFAFYLTPNFVGKHFQKNTMRVYRNGRLEPQQKYVSC